LDGLGKTKAKEAAPSMNALAANSWNSGSWANKPGTTTPSAGSNAFGNFGSMATNAQSNTNNNVKNNNNNNNFNDLLF
jgi:epsin